MTTGWPAPALAQDECRPLFKWFADKPDARQLVREHCQTIKEASMALTPEKVESLIRQADDRAPKTGSIFRALVKLTEAEVQKQNTALIESQSQEIAALKEQVEGLRKDAERYAVVRRGQHWSVIDGIGDPLRGDRLDARVDAVLAAKGGSDG